MRDSAGAIRRDNPVFGPPLRIFVRGEDSAFYFYCLDIENVSIRNGGKPDVFAVIFPVLMAAPSFFPFPGDPVADFEILEEYPVYGSRGIPVAADVDRRGFREQARKFAYPRFKP